MGTYPRKVTDPEKERRKSNRLFYSSDLWTMDLLSKHVTDMFWCFLSVAVFRCDVGFDYLLHRRLHHRFCLQKQREFIYKYFSICVCFCLSLSVFACLSLSLWPRSYVQSLFCLPFLLHNIESVDIFQCKDNYEEVGELLNLSNPDNEVYEQRKQDNFSGHPFLFLLKTRTPYRTFFLCCDFSFLSHCRPEVKRGISDQCLVLLLFLDLANISFFCFWPVLLPTFQKKIF